MQKVHSHKVGLVFGGLFALGHALWALMVFLGFAKPLLDFIFCLHFLRVQFDIPPFDLGNAIMLVIVTGIIGYIIGRVFCVLWNYVHGTAHNG